jgi:hypothetical protein
MDPRNRGDKVSEEQVDMKKIKHLIKIQFAGIEQYTNIYIRYYAK